MTNRSPTPPAIPDHELRCCIGEGSYGEVWLARNAMGTLRAVKIVHRASFQDDRPYEREFAGLKNFEPVSRAHEGLVDILQIGRNDEKGFFYYVMELADDAAAEKRSNGVLEHCGDESKSGPHHSTTPPIHYPTRYAPLTLESRIRSEGRIPVKGCVAIVAALADALGHLHKAGLVHRDIKPSNIIFVGGVPKLADVGLVARADSARTFVGTEGFVPPEGPGTPRADIYSLGKCLYEMAMGKDRQAFPSPPTRLDDFPDRAELLELNEVITKACDPEPTQRYQSVEELAADLGILQAGQSVLQARRRRKFRKTALLGAALLGSAAFGSMALLRPRSSPPKPPSLEVVREFSLPGTGPADGAKLGHYRGKSGLELFNARLGNLAVANLDGGILAQRTPSGISGGQFDLQLLADTDGDGRDEAFVAWRDGTNLHLSVFNQSLMEIHRFNSIGSMEKGRAGSYPISSLVALKFLPAAAQRPPALLVGVETGKNALWPRAVRLYNFPDKEQIWDAPFPSMAVHQAVSFREGPATGKILLGTQSHHNGAKQADGTDDGHSYLYALSEETGERLWIVPVGLEFTQIAPQLAAINGTNYIFAAASRQFESFLAAGISETNDWQPTVLKFDMRGRELARFTAKNQITSLTLADLEGKGKAVALAPCADGSLLVLDPDLLLLRRVLVVTNSYSWVNLRIVAVQDLDHDKRPEVVLSSSQVEFVSGTNTSDPDGPANVRRLHENSVIVLDHELQPLARRVIHGQEQQTGFEVLVATDQAHNAVSILALDQKVTVLRFKRR